MHARNLEVPCGGGDRAVPEEDLDGAWIDPGFEQMGGKAMPQRMDAMAPLEASRLLGVRGDLLSRAHGHGMMRVLPWEQPPRRAIQLPIRPQGGQQTGGEEGVAVFASFALLHTDQHTRTLDVGELQVDDLTDAQTGGVGRHQQGPVLGVARAREETLQFFKAQDVWQARPPCAWREVEMEHIPVERLRVEELEPTGHLVTGTPREVPFDEQMMEVRVHLLWTQLVRGAPGELRQACDRGDIGVLSLRGQAL